MHQFHKFIFGMKLHMFRSVPLSIIRSSFTVHSAMVYVIQVCRELSSRNRIEVQFHPDPARNLSTNLYDIYHCWVYSEWTPDDGHRHCPKHVEFRAKNKICEISASSWSCKEICYDARSRERKILIILPLSGTWGRLGELMQQTKMEQKIMKAMWVGEL